MPASTEPLAPILDQVARSAASVVLEDSAGREMSGHAFLDLVGRAAALIASLGIRPGDRVLVQVPKSIEALGLTFAILRIGAVFMPLDNGVPVEGVKAAMDDALPSLVIATQSTIECLSNKLRVSRVRTTLSLEPDGSGTFKMLSQGQQPARTGAGMRASELAAVYYPLPQPGRPMQGIKLSHGGLLRQVEIAREHFAIAPDDVMLHALTEWADPAALGFAGAALLARARLILIGALGRAEMPGRRPATLLIGDSESAGGAQGSRYLRLAIYKAPGAASGNLRRFISTPETGLLCATDDEGVLRVSAGSAVRLRDASGDLVVGPGRGRLEIAGAQLFTGYWRQAAATRGAVTGDAYFATALQARRFGDGSIAVDPQP